MCLFRPNFLDFLNRGKGDYFFKESKEGGETEVQDLANSLGLTGSDPNPGKDFDVFQEKVQGLEKSLRFNFRTSKHWKK